MIGVTIPVSLFMSRSYQTPMIDRFLEKNKTAEEALASGELKQLSHSYQLFTSGAGTFSFY